MVQNILLRDKNTKLNSRNYIGICYNHFVIEIFKMIGPISLSLPEINSIKLLASFESICWIHIVLTWLPSDIFPGLCYPSFQIEYLLQCRRRGINQDFILKKILLRLSEKQSIIPSCYCTALIKETWISFQNNFIKKIKF